MLNGLMRAELARLENIRENRRVFQMMENQLRELTHADKTNELVEQRSEILLTTKGAIEPRGLYVSSKGCDQKQ